MIRSRRTQTVERNSFHEKRTGRYHFKETKVIFVFDLRQNHVIIFEFFSINFGKMLAHSVS